MSAVPAVVLAALLASGAAPVLVSVPAVSLDGLDPAVAAPLAEARARLDAALREGRPAAALFADAGRRYHAYDMRAPAEACYLNAAALAPDDFRSWYLLGVTRHEGGDLEGAAAALGRALAGPDRYYPGLLRMAAVQLALGRPEEAERWLAPARVHSPDDPALLALDGEIALAGGRPAAAAAALEEALRVQPRASRLHYLLGMAYRGLSRRAEARAELAQAGAVGVAARDPVLDEVRALRRGETGDLIEGQQAFRAGDHAAAAAAFARAVEASGGSSVPALVNLAAAEERLGRHDAALARLQQARAVDPGHPLVNFNLGLLLAQDGRSTEAEALLAEAVIRSPQDAEARFEWGLVLVTLGRFDDADRALQPLVLDEARCRRVRSALAARPPSEGAGRAALDRRAAGCQAR